MLHKKTALFLFLLFIGSLLLTSVFFSPADILSDTPVYTDDYSMHYSQCLSAKRFFSSFGRGWGYDPFFLAGFPRQTLADADNKAWEALFCLLAPLLGNGFSFKVFILIFLLCYPFMTYAAARNFKLSPAQSLTASVLAVVFFHLSLAIDFVFCGMISYVFICYLSVYYFSLFYKLMDNFSLRNYAVAVLFATVMLQIHILTTLVIAVPIILLYLCYCTRLTRNQNLAVFCIPLAALAFNSYWLMVIWVFLNDKTLRPENWEFVFQIRNVLEPLNVYLLQHKTVSAKAIKLPIFSSTFIDAFLLLFSLISFRVWYRQKAFKLLIPFAGSFIFFFLVTYYGSHTSFFPQFQPERFSIPLNLFLLLPAALGLSLAVDRALRGRGALVAVFALCFAFVVLYRPIIKPVGSILKHNFYRVNCTFPPELEQLLDFIDNSTTREARVLIEDSECSARSAVHQYYGGHFPALFPEHSKREYLCGPRPLYPVKHSYASFTDGLLFERDIGTYGLEDLQDRFALFNVKWVVCWSRKSIAVFDRYPEYLRQIGQVHKFTIYEVLRKPSYFIKGRGRAAADYNRIELRNLEPDDREVIISYHWMQKLKTDPPVLLDKTMLGGDPVGFIKLINPPEEVLIYNAY